MPSTNPLLHTVPLPIPTPQRVQEFQALYERRFGVNLPQEQAADALTRLMQFLYLFDGAGAGSERVSGESKADL